MPELTIDGQRVRVEDGMSVAAALLNAGPLRTRRALDGAPRAPLCGMGTCFECRATIDGRVHERSCMVICAEGMEVRRDA